MRTAILQMDPEADHGRTRWCMTASFTAHVLLAIAIALSPRTVSQAETLTEITLIEPGDLGPSSSPPAAPPAMAPERETGAPVQSPADENVLRMTRHAEIAPAAQSPATSVDRIAARLATLEQSEPAVIHGASTVPGSVWATPAAATGTGAGGSGTSPLSLNRGAGTGSGPALSLHRGSGGGGSQFAPAIAATAPPAERSASSAPASAASVAARKSLAGAMLAGPIADRRVISYVQPIYPGWAQHEAVEGSVTLYFVVRPDGSVRENVLVQKTAGFEDFDESARTALLGWRFAPLTEGRTGEQWGTITFHFQLREGGG